MIQKIETRLIDIADAPAIDGLIFRHFRGADDYPHMVAVIEGSAQADSIERVETVENVAHAYEHLTRSDPYEDMVFAEINEQVVGYTRVGWYQEETDSARIYYHFCFLLPKWRSQGILPVLMANNEKHAQVMAARHVADGDHDAIHPRYFNIWATTSEREVTAYAEQSGYQPVAYGEDMVRDLSEPLPDVTLPDGLEVRPVDETQFRAIWEADDEAFRDHWGYAPQTEEDYQQFLTDPIVMQPELWQIAWDGDEVAGQVRSFIHHKENEEFQRKRGYTEFISVRRPWRRRGLARTLLVRSMAILKERGMEEAALGAAYRQSERCLSTV